MMLFWIRLGIVTLCVAFHLGWRWASQMWSLHCPAVSQGGSIAHSSGGRTAWRLFKAFTEILKGNLGELPRRTQAHHGLMDSACGLVARRLSTGCPFSGKPKGFT